MCFICYFIEDEEEAKDMGIKADGFFRQECRRYGNSLMSQLLYKKMDKMSNFLNFRRTQAVFLYILFPMKHIRIHFMSETPEFGVCHGKSGNHKIGRTLFLILVKTDIVSGDVNEVFRSD